MDWKIKLSKLQGHQRRVSVTLLCSGMCLTLSWLGRTKKGDYTTLEKEVLKRSSVINGHLFVPWLASDLNEKFTYRYEKVCLVCVTGKSHGMRCLLVYRPRWAAPALHEAAREVWRSALCVEVLGHDWLIPMCVSLASPRGNCSRQTTADDSSYFKLQHHANHYYGLLVCRFAGCGRHVRTEVQETANYVVHLSSESAWGTCWYAFCLP